MRKGHVSGIDDFDSVRPTSAFGDFQNLATVDAPRTADVMRRCESTCIPGITWAELLARDRRGQTPFIFSQDLLGLSLVAPQHSAALNSFAAPNYMYSSIRRVHPLGREAKFAESLRGGSTGACVCSGVISVCLFLVNLDVCVHVVREHVMYMSDNY